MTRAKVIIKDTGELARIVQEIEKAKRAIVKVGIQGNEASTVRTSDSGAALTLGEIATVNEFGSEDGRVPARPFMRNTWDNRQKELRAIQRKTLEQIATGRMTAEKALDVIGLWFANAIKKTITDGVAPANAPRTIEKKGSSKPLIDTGALRQSITHVVEMNGSGGGE